MKQKINTTAILLVLVIGIALFVFLLVTQFQGELSFEQTTNRVSSNDTGTSEDANTTSAVPVSEFVLLKEGESKSLPLLELGVTLESVVLEPCGEDGEGVENQNQNVNAPEGFDNCQPRHGSVVLKVFHKPEKVSENDESVGITEPETITFGTIPGFQQGKKHLFQAVEYSEGLLRLFVRSLSEEMIVEEGGNTGTQAQ